MSTFHVGDRVRVVSPSFPGLPEGTVTGPNNELTYLTIDVVLDRDGEPSWIFAPDELEHIDDGTDKLRGSQRSPNRPNGRHL